ncbi:phage DNA ejection protein [Serratia sp. UGAL515B_01]|uniref:phage DNA ejection protein n=1 Tax=Serratia sp. UGAL515B_01 TaxID=2986763 RepID=UPI0029542B5B|nr:phage DNA ejection protein [Serratia sp. UGAL515B_01]WON77584.1 DNA transfer protein [Serratia sp. UGAL515B_01]
MATWQQGGAGGLLGAIGQVNSNAPQSSDVNVNLARIGQNQDFARAGGNNLGMQAVQGLAGLNEIYKQQQAQERAGQFKQLYGQAFSSGDRTAMRQLAAQYPEQFESVQKGLGFIDDDQRNAVGSLAASARVAAASPESMGAWLTKNQSELQRIGARPQDVASMYQQDPKEFLNFVDHLGLSALGPEKYYDLQDKAEGRKVQMRGQDIGAETARRGQDITARGQDISASTARRGQDLAMQRASARGAAGPSGSRVVQLADGRTVNVGGKLHGAGANAFYEGIDDSGNMVRVPASAIAAPATSAANAQNYAMKKDIDAIAGAKTDQLDFMTGVTGSSGNPAKFAELRSRLPGNKEQRQLYNATQRIQGRMQNQGIAAARDMGASGINTVAEAKMYFQGMPQVDYSSPEAMQQSIADIQQYTDNYNQQYQVNVGGESRPSKTQEAQPKPQANSGFQSLWGD